MFYDDTLYYVYSKLGYFSARERANYKQAKLEELIEENDFNKEAFTSNQIEYSLDVLYNYYNNWVSRYFLDRKIF